MKIRFSSQGKKRTVAFLSTTMLGSPPTLCKLQVVSQISIWLELESFNRRWGSEVNMAQVPMSVLVSPELVLLEKPQLLKWFLSTA